jgi:NADH-quinone oxidoreductase subunit K
MFYNYLLFSTIIFSLSLFGIFFCYKKLIIVLMLLDVLFFSIILNFVIFSVYLNDIMGYYYALILLGITAVETSFGLIFIINFSRYEDINKLKKLRKIIL